MAKLNLYHPKSRAVRSIDKDDALRLRALKRAGFLVGDLPAPRKPKAPVEEKPLPPTEGEDEALGSEGEVVLAEHEPVPTPEPPKDDEADDEAEPDAVDDEAEEEEDDG